MNINDDLFGSEEQMEADTAWLKRAGLLSIPPISIAARDAELAELLSDPNFSEFEKSEYREQFVRVIESTRRELAYSARVKQDLDAELDQMTISGERDRPWRA